MLFLASLKTKVRSKFSPGSNFSLRPNNIRWSLPGDKTKGELGPNFGSVNFRISITPLAIFIDCNSIFLKFLLETSITLRSLVALTVAKPAVTSTPGLGLVLWVKSVFNEQAKGIWEKLSPKIVTVTKGWSEAYGLFLEGEADMVLSYTTSPAYHIMAEDEKKYKAAIFDDGHYLQVEVAAITKKGSKSKLSFDFMNFILSEKFQSVIPTTNWMFPVTNIKLPDTFENLNKPSKALLMNSDDIENNRKKWISEWRRALVK